jgi:hypothetical protein
MLTVGLFVYGKCCTSMATRAQRTLGRLTSGNEGSFSMSAAESQQQEEEPRDSGLRRLPVTQAEARVLDLLIGTAIKRPGAFGASDQALREALLETVNTLRRKLNGIVKPEPEPKKPATRRTKSSPEPTVKKRVLAKRRVEPAAEAPAPAPVAPVEVPPQPVEEAAPAAPAATVPAPRTESAPAAATEKPRTPGQLHFLVIYSRKKRKPVYEKEFSSYKEAFDARRPESKRWPEALDVEAQVFSGPSRKVLQIAQSKYFGARRPVGRP